MKNWKIFSLLGFACLIVVMGKVFLNKKVNRQNPVQNRFQPVTSPTPPAKEVASSNAVTKNEVQVLTQTPGCSLGQKAPPYVQVPWRSYIKLARGQSSYLGQNGEGPCLLRDRKYPAEFIRRDPKTGFIFFKERIPDIELTEIKSVPLQGIGREIPGADKAFLQTLLKSAQLSFKSLADKSKASGPLILLKIRTYEKKWGLATYSAPLQHPSAQNLTSEVASGDLSQYQIFDIRPSSSFRAGALPRAVNLEPGDYGFLDKGLLSPERLFSGDVSFNLDVLPKNKEAKLLIYSFGPGDYSSYNAVTYLAFLGYKNIFWYRGGWDEWKKIPALATPPSFATALDAPQALSLKTQNAVFLDASSSELFAEEHIQGALSQQLNAKLDSFGRHLFRPQILTEASLIENQEELLNPPRLPKTSALVVYGRNEYDIRAFKVLVLLYRLGYRKLYYLKGGFKEWSHFQDLFPNDYLISTANRMRARGKNK